MSMMTLEQMDHFLRHIKMHVLELQGKNFSKDKKYLDNLKQAQNLALEISHDLIHIMRTKEYAGYEDADFDFDTHLPQNWHDHIFRDFDYDSFKFGIRIRSLLDNGLCDEYNIRLPVEEAQNQLKILGDAIQDSAVFIMMLEEYFAK